LIFRSVSLLFSYIFILAFASTAAQAQCADPVAVAGTQEYFEAPDNTFKFCNGTIWVDMGGGGGGGSLGDLTDVDITNPQDGQPLVYDSATSTWVNAACDNVPNSAAFTDLVEQSLSTLVTSNIIQITGIGCSVDAYISGDGSPQIRVCDDGTCSSVDHNWTASTVSVDADQYIQARLTTSGSQATTFTGTVAVGGLSDPWLVKTVGPKRVFATSTTYTGNLGGLTGADAKCQERADAASLGGVFKAWLSDSSDSASSRLNHSTLNYLLVNDTLIASDWDDLTDGDLHARINVDELGNTVNGTAWTNTSRTGASRGSTRSCEDWTFELNTQDGYHGSLAWADYDWTEADFNSCSGNRRLYCFEQ